MTNSIVTPKTFLAYSLGCRTNQAEIETISQQLMERGFRLAGQDEEPNIVLLNTCIVTQKAEKETRQKIRELREKHRGAFLIVLGCAATAKEKFEINLPEADLYLSNKDKNKVVEIVIKKLKPLPSKRLTNLDSNKYHLSGRKFIKIQDGCNKFCSYCITTHLRGKPTDVPPGKIIKEINFWAKKEIKEIILTGINIGLYGTSDRDNTCHDLVELINRILSETKIERLSFSSIDPEMLLSAEGSVLIVNNPRVSQCFHLSLQSGSTSVLARMNRKTDLRKLRAVLTNIKTQNPFFTFRADVIVGFPGESEKEFQETLDFIRKTKISFAHVFSFSPRKGTIAYEMIKNKKWTEVSEDIKKERMKKIRKTIEEIRNNEAEYLIAKLLNCLIVKNITNGYEGVTENGWPIIISSKQQVVSSKGKIVTAKITGFNINYLLGEIVSLPTNRRKTSGTSTLPSDF